MIIALHFITKTIPFSLGSSNELNIMQSQWSIWFTTANEAERSRFGAGKFFSRVMASHGFRSANH